MKQNNAFTLIEVLISMALFVMLTGIAAQSFMRLSAGSTKTLKVLELHTCADTLLRLIESDLRNMQATTAFKIRAESKIVELTFMIPSTNQEDHLVHRGATFSTVNPFYAMHPRFADFVWVHWQWQDGVLKRGVSKTSANMHPDGGANKHNRVNNTRQYLRSVDARTGIPIGVQGNGVPPTPQRYFKYFEGLGSTVHPLSMDGDSAAKYGEKLQVYQTVSESQYVNSTICELFDTDVSSWRSDDYRHLYKTLELGNTDPIADAYAVLNEDGLSVNKDRLNLLGCDATDSNGYKIYPSQLKVLYGSIEYLDLSFIKRDGHRIADIDDDDTLNDGSTSIDINGVDPVLGHGSGNRPKSAHVSFLMHDVTVEYLDDEDFDQDNDTEESLASAVRAVVEAEGHATRVEKIQAFLKHINRFGFAGILIDQSVGIDQ